MKKNIFSIGIVLTAVALLAVGCTKENRTVSLNARIDNRGAEKVYMYGTLPCWSNGDAIFINNTSYEVSVSATNSSSAQISDVASNDAGYCAIYPAGIVTGSSISTGVAANVTLPRFQEYVVENGSQKVELPMAAYTAANGTMLNFHNICSLIKVVVVNTQETEALSLSGIEMAASSQVLSGAGTVTVTPRGADVITMGDASTSGNYRAVSLNIASSPTIAADGGTDSFYIVAPVFTDINNVTFTLIDENDRKYAQFEFQSVQLEYNSLTTVTLTVDAMHDFSNLFTVNSSGLQVEFSKGNLQWSYNSGATHSIASTGSNSGTFRFAPNQYDHIGADNSNISSTYNGWIDLFAYGTSGVTVNRTTYYPYLTSSSTSSYCSSNIAGTNYDWGKFNSILNGTTNDAYNVWRTPTAAEWDYVLNRSGDEAANINAVTDVCYAKATVNNVPGLMLFPDEFVWPTSVKHYPPFNVSTASFTEEGAVFTTEEWDKLESANVIFLPTTGHRVAPNNNSYVTSVGYYNSRGLYWSSTMTGNDAQILQFKSEDDGDNTSNVNVSTSARGRTCNGIAVRLVKDYHL